MAGIWVGSLLVTVAAFTVVASALTRVHVWMAYEVEGLMEESMVVLGECSVAVKTRRSCCGLLFSGEGNVTGRERETSHGGEEG